MGDTPLIDLNGAGLLTIEADLIKRFIEALRKSKSSPRARAIPVPLWARVCTATTHGATWSYHICKHYGFDPDETWKP